MRRPRAERASSGPQQAVDVALALGERAGRRKLPHAVTFRGSNRGSFHFSHFVTFAHQSGSLAIHKGTPRWRGGGNYGVNLTNGFKHLRGGKRLGPRNRR